MGFGSNAKVYTVKCFNINKKAPHDDQDVIMYTTISENENAAISAAKFDVKGRTEYIVVGIDSRL